MNVSQIILSLQKILDNEGDLEVFNENDKEIDKIRLHTGGYALPNGDIMPEKFIQIKSS